MRAESVIPTEATDNDLLRHMLSGDSSAFATIYGRYVKSVYAYAYSMVKSPQEAEEVTQQTFVTAWERRSAIRIVDESLLPWLLTTARYKGLNRSRQLRRSSELTELDEQDGTDAPRRSAEDDYLADLTSTAVRDAISSLSPTDRAVFELCIAEQLTYDQAAKRLGLTHGAVRNRLSRLRGALRRDLLPMKEGHWL